MHAWLVFFAFFFTQVCVGALGCLLEHRAGRGKGGRKGNGYSLKKQKETDMATGERGRKKKHVEILLLYY